MYHDIPIKGRLTIRDVPSPESHTEAQMAYLAQLCMSVRLRRDPQVMAAEPDPLREAVGLPIGDDACYYVGDHALGFNSYGVTDWTPPAGVPSWACPWRLHMRVHVRGASGRLEWRDAACTPLLEDVLPTFQPDEICGRRYILEPIDGNATVDLYVDWIQYLLTHFLRPWGLQLSGSMSWRISEHEVGLLVATRDGVGVYTETRIRTPQRKL